MTDSKQIIELKESLKPAGKPDSGNPLDEIDVPEFREGYKIPPGSLGEFMCEIENHFENREEGEVYRLPGAIALAQVMAGRYIIGPSAKNKCATGTFIVGRSGAGKGAPSDFVKAYSENLGITPRVSKSTVTSLRQIKERLIEADGFLLYIADDCPEHLQAWSDTRSPLGETASWFRTSISGDWFPESPVVTLFQEKLASAQNPKLILSAAQAQGWMIPRIGESDGPIDYRRLAKMNHDIGRRLNHAMQCYDLCVNEKGIQNVRFIPFITVTPEQGIATVRRWEKDGGMGRSLFIKGHEHMPELKNTPDMEINKTIINEWKPRIPGGFFNVEYANDGVSKYYEMLRRRIDKSSNIPGVIGSVGPRSAQMVIELATLCAFADLSSRNGMTPKINECHIEWAYATVMNSMYDLRDYLEGEAEFDGLENTEWDNIVMKVKKCIESKAFAEKPYISVVKNKLCRDRISKIISAADSNSIQVTPDKFTYEVIIAISENRHSPIELDPENPSNIRLSGGGSWSGLRMNASVRNILSSAMKRMRFMRNLK